RPILSMLCIAICRTPLESLRGNSTPLLMEVASSVPPPVEGRLNWREGAAREKEFALVPERALRSEIEFAVAACAADAPTPSGTAITGWNDALQVPFAGPTQA